MVSPMLWFGTLLKSNFHFGGKETEIDLFAHHASTKKDLIELINILKPIKTEHELIRIGGDEDGGYLVPNDLSGIKACFSPGVGPSSTFETEISNLTGAKCFLADASVESSPEKNFKHDFEKKFIGSSNQYNFISLENWVNQKYSESGDLILQMDIEGSEYDVLIHTSIDLIKRFRIIIIEFHYLNYMLGAGILSLFKSIFGKLTTNHSVVHLHPNNCCGTIEFSDISIPKVMEITLLRNDCFSQVSRVDKYPHKLDKDNVKNNKTIILSDHWR